MKKNDLIKNKTDFWTSNLKKEKSQRWLTCQLASTRVGLNKQTRFSLTGQPGPTRL